MAEESVQRRLAAILAADVVGYTRLIRADEEGTLAALKTLRADIIYPKIVENHGRVVKLMGDGMLAEFPSVVDAVRSAAEIQRAVAEHNVNRSEDQRRHKLPLHRSHPFAASRQTQGGCRSSRSESHSTGCEGSTWEIPVNLS